MGKWDDDSNEERKGPDERFLKLEVGATRLRILSEGPAKKWVHWINQKPLNCPEDRSCPVCQRFFDLRTVDPDAAKTYQRRRSFLVNVLVYKPEPVVKILAFGNDIAKSFAEFDSTYGDLRNYDIIIKKEKTGPLPMNVKYLTLFGGEKAALPEDLAALAEETHDLEAELKPASLEDLTAAVNGGDGEDSTPKRSLASTKEIEALGKLIKTHGPDLSFEDFGLDVTTATSTQVSRLITQLSAKS